MRHKWELLSQTNKVAVAIPLVSALVAAVAGLVTAIVPMIAASLSSDAPLELVDVAVLDFEPRERAAIVDIKVRTHGQEVAFIKRADLILYDAREIEFCNLPSPQGVTYVYDVELPAAPPELPMTVSKPLSQSLRPNESDRFVLKLGTKGFGEYTIGGSVYLFTLRLYYNEGDGSYLESRPLLAYVSYPSEPEAMTVIDTPERRECIRKNAMKLKDLTDQDAFRSEGLTEMADNYKEAAGLK